MWASQVFSEVAIHNTTSLSSFLVLRTFYNSFAASPICPILSSSFYSSIFPPFSLSTSQTAVSLPCPLLAGFIPFHCLQFHSNLCQYWQLYSLSNHLNKLLAVNLLGISPLVYLVLFSLFSCHLTSLSSLSYSSSNSFSRSFVFSRFSLLSHVSPSAVNPFHCTKNLSLPLTFLLFRILSTSHFSCHSCARTSGSVLYGLPLHQKGDVNKATW